MSVKARVFACFNIFTIQKTNKNASSCLGNRIFLLDKSCPQLFGNHCSILGLFLLCEGFSSVGNCVKRAVVGEGRHYTFRGAMKTSVASCSTHTPHTLPSRRHTNVCTEDQLFQRTKKPETAIVLPCGGSLSHKNACSHVDRNDRPHIHTTGKTEVVPATQIVRYSLHPMSRLCGG